MSQCLRRPTIWLGLLAAAVTLHLPGPAPAAEESNSLKGGSTSIQFLAFGGTSRSGLGTSGLYVKRHLTDQSALRAGADFSLDESSGKSPAGYNGYTSNYRSYYVTVAGEFERYLDATGPTTMFVGVGPYWSRGRSFNERSQSYRYDSTTVVNYYDKHERRTWEIGAAVTAGFEWFIKRKLSVLGRVGATMGFGESHDINQSTYNGLSRDSRSDRLNSTTATARTSAAALGLSAYF